MKFSLSIYMGAQAHGSLRSTDYRLLCTFNVISGQDPSRLMTRHSCPSSPLNKQFKGLGEIRPEEWNTTRVTASVLPDG